MIALNKLSAFLCIAFFSFFVAIGPPTQSAHALQSSLLEDIAGELIKDALDIETDVDSSASDCGMTDCDRDGQKSFRDGGDDCDDSDTNRFLGNAEVADDRDHDEDCDATTYGAIDNDGDGYNANIYCNIDAEGASHCGFDCDDNNLSIGPGSQVCNPQNGSKAVLICTKIEKGQSRPPNFVAGKWSTSNCSGKCVAQPNGTGICVK